MKRCRYLCYCGLSSKAREQYVEKSTEYYVKISLNDIFNFFALKRKKDRM